MFTESGEGSAVIFSYLGADGQAHARAILFGGIEAVKNLFQGLRIHARAIILHGKDEPLIRVFERNLDMAVFPIPV